MTDIQSLPFDQYQRYRLVADLVGRIRGDGSPLRILDVGGRTALLRSFLPNDRIDLVDVEASGEAGLVLGDGSRLPFKDDSFDVVAAFDTLEHVPPAFRDGFVDECARVARYFVILAGPYAAPEVDEAEELLKTFMEVKLDLQHRYLQEHRDNGLPVRDRVEERLRSFGAEVQSFGHGNIDRWLALMCMEMYMDHDPGLRSIAARFFSFYNERLYASDHADPVYRHAVVGALKGAPLPSDEGLLEPARAPEGTLRLLHDLETELLAFDKDKDVWYPEFERLKGEIRKLEVDLEGHQSRLADRTADLAEHVESLKEAQTILATTQSEFAEEKATLEADLAEHDRSLEEAREILATTQKEAAQEKASLEADLAEHKNTLSVAQAEHDSFVEEAREVEGQLRHELDNREQALTELREHLAQTEESAAAIQAELVRARADIEGLVADMAQKDALIGRMNGELRDRVQNLKRAFARKKWEI